jgi:hypothetical protein
MPALNETRKWHKGFEILYADGVRRTSETDLLDEAN